MQTVQPTLVQSALQVAAANEVCEMSWGDFKPKLADAVSLSHIHCFSRAMLAPRQLAAR